ncbi:cell wall-binding repeat-containing protein [Halobacillus kuroshimensis]|uniref:cell wall-binding repeat-containing protein n=1 Tax=Halobacillus kuroshimensis TaxID=302481 RepID=UPI0003F736E0|nr:cell wall-binding repeat-containing protein [Halobacillus kuroshimensis]
MKKVSGLLLASVLVFGMLPTVTSAADGTYACENYEEISCSDIAEMLTEKALERNIPPEVAKAVAFAESNWSQWTDDGQTKANVNKEDDGSLGIGIMQVTDDGYDTERLRSDIGYNMDVGLDILLDKWKLAERGVIPTVNDASKDVIEHWYFPVMAYNGVVEVNSPVVKADGSVNTDAYQEKVFRYIENYNNGMALTDLPFEKDDFIYDPSDNDAEVKFAVDHYDVDGPLTKSRQMFEEGDTVITVDGTNVRRTKDGNGGFRLSDRQEAEIIDASIYYDESDQSPARHWVRYRIQLEDGRTGYVASGALTPATTRLKGATRIETAVEISKEGWQDGAETVVLAKAFDFPDALSGAPLAYQNDAPVLLTRSGELTPAAKEEIERLGADKVIILGSTGAVSERVENQLNDMNLSSVERIGGSDRYETAALIAESLNSDSGEAVIATGRNYPDALAAAPYAARQGVPILLTRPESVPEVTLKALTNTATAHVIGGTGVISEEAASQLPAEVERIAGDTRFDTAAEIIETLDVGHQQALAATGYNYADALTGAVLAAKKDAPLLLVRKEEVPESLENTIQKRSIRDYILLGGEDVVDVAAPLTKLANQVSQ